MFDIDEFIVACRQARAETEPRRAMKEVLARACSRPEAMATALEPKAAGIELLYHDADLTVINVVWAPHMQIFPHDHRMWAAIGIYAGAEDNTFYGRFGAEHRTIAESGGKRLDTGDVLVLGAETIHGVTNPRSELTAAIHVYGGDFVNQPRRQWGPGPLEERPYNADDIARTFEQANRKWHQATDQ